MTWAPDPDLNPDPARVQESLARLRMPDGPEDPAVVIARAEQLVAQLHAATGRADASVRYLAEDFGRLARRELRLRTYSRLLRRLAVSLVPAVAGLLIWTVLLVALLAILLRAGQPH